ncbi:MAG: hypothetical protein OXC11_04825, partial [Rhodospirillales bacterium]|nr:hypothetical protein [Rhodospirillales bacterium]
MNYLSSCGSRRPVFCGFLRTFFRVVVPLSAALSIAASCGGGGSGSGAQTPVQSASVQSASVQVPPEPCVQTHDHGCLTESEFEAQASELATGYADRTSFHNQWGLAAIGADRAYANLELQLGPDAKPGEGLTVGVLDTGI